jgi:hypothetical protein
LYLLPSIGTLLNTATHRTLYPKALKFHPVILYALHTYTYHLISVYSFCLKTGFYSCVCPH